MLSKAKSASGGAEPKSQKQAPTPAAPVQNQGRSGVGKGVIIGCVIGCVVLVIILVIILFIGCGVFKWGTGYNWPETPSESSQGL
jgi:hypothetical protein